jgi:hypothetical protein
MRHVKLRANAPVDDAALARLLEDAYADIHRRLDSQPPYNQSHHRDFK